MRIKLGGEVETLGRDDAVRVPAGTPRAVRNDTDADAVFAMVSVRTEDPQAESVHHDGFWPAP